MKILFPISSYFPSQVGGPSNSVYWMCTGLLKDQNVHTTIVTTKVGIEEEDNIVFNKWYVNKNNKILYTNSSGMLPFKMMLESLKQIKHHDVVHLSSLFYPPSLIISILGIILNKKIVVSVRGELYPFALKSFRPRLKQIFIKIYKLFKKKIVFHATVKKEEEYIKAVFGSDINTVLLPNYILKPKQFKKSKLKENYILYLGRLHKIKGLENLFKSLNISTAFNNSNFKLKLAGKSEGNYKQKLEKLAKELKIEHKIEFLGQIQGVEKENLIANSKFLILPSYTENFGNVVVEALTHGIPVVASTGTPWKILEKHKAGFWVDNSINSLKDIVDYIINMKKEDYLEMCSNAKQLLEEEFDIDTNYIKWSEFYNKFQKSNAKT